jgi:hypothetical protein
MTKVKDIDLSDVLSACMPRPDSSLVVIDKHLLALLDQLVAMGLAESWEVRGPNDHEYTSTKLMQKFAKKILVHRRTMGQSEAK